MSPVPAPAPAAEPSANDWRTAAAIQAKSERIVARGIDSFTEFPDWTTQTLAAFGLTARPWRFPSVQEALGVPPIFRAVSLISNTTGSLAVEAFRDGTKLEGADRPRVIVRPDPFKTANKFYRDTAFFMATRGEVWWWIAKRDGLGLPISIIVVPPWEITLDPTNDRLNPQITWNVQGKSVVMDPLDMRQITYLPDPVTLRGLGPLQACGAAVSVAVESQAWAANFYAEGGYPSVLIKAAGSLRGSDDDPDGAATEAELLRDQWRSKDHNTPRVIDEGIESVTEFPVNPQGAQMLDARLANKGDAANMFGVPGVLLEYNAPGSALTYQNIQEVFRLFVQTSLAPNYLEPIEQELSDLLPRSTVARFNVNGFERADAKTRWETYGLAVPVIGQEAAAAWANEAEGFTPGNIEYAPVPFSPPAAFPSSLPAARSSEAVRCDGKRVLKGMLRPCGKLLAEAGPFIGRCPRCGKEHSALVA
jgi:HK97 family phage portal protein